MERPLLFGRLCLYQPVAAVSEFKAESVGITQNSTILIMNELQGQKDCVNRHPIH
ncbi:MAG: hypothetical protein V7629_03825 [Motiliproteus sp.]